MSSYIIFSWRKIITLHQSEVQSYEFAIFFRIFQFRLVKTLLPIRPSTPRPSAFFILHYSKLLEKPLNQNFFSSKLILNQTQLFLFNMYIKFNPCRWVLLLITDWNLKVLQDIKNVTASVPLFVFGFIIFTVGR